MPHKKALICYRLKNKINKHFLMISKTFKTFLLAAIFSTMILSAFDPQEFWEGHLAKKTMPEAPTPAPDTGSENIGFKQWFIGPLLVPSPTTMNPKTPGFEPTVTWLDTYGSYRDDWKTHKNTLNMTTVQFLGYWQFGFNECLGTEILTAYNMNYNKYSSSYHFTDTTWRFGYQISTDKKVKNDWTPNLRFIFQEVFPTGHYQRLNPAKSGIDITGAGTFQTGFFFVAEKSFKYNTPHAYNLYGAFGFFVPTNFRVHRQNLYGGNNFTNGKVRPGSIFSVYFSGEFEVSNHVNLAFDSYYQVNLSGKFTGNMGNGAPVIVPQMVNFSVAIPEIEITISEKAGFLIGPWFTFAGQNTAAFAAAFVAFFIMF